jgi:hypothetical protein
MNPQSLIWVAIEWRSVCGMASAMWGSPLRAPMGGVKPLPYIKDGPPERTSGTTEAVEQWNSDAVRSGKWEVRDEGGGHRCGQ